MNGDKPGDDAVENGNVVPLKPTLVDSSGYPTIPVAPRASNDELATEVSQTSFSVEEIKHYFGKIFAQFAIRKTPAHREDRFYREHMIGKTGVAARHPFEGDEDIVEFRFLVRDELRERIIQVGLKFSIKTFHEKPKIYAMEKFTEVQARIVNTLSVGKGPIEINRVSEGGIVLPDE